MSNRFDEQHDQSPHVPTNPPEMDLTSSPTNDLERALAAAESGRLDQRELFKIFVHSEVYEIAAQPQAKDSPVFPLALHDPEQGRMIAVFSSSDHALRYREQAPLLLPLQGSQVLEQVPAGHGVVLNPGSPISLTIPGYGVLNLRRDFGIRPVTM
ncbi:SseB family protein [Blastopirellula retiformator]|uniref:SseB protein N-terminal domain-containing protein n=1 Tax=Blastopirellula retiformator TaxID=2527970 RepID=A0A5C5VJB2_9BACT|nr:SseB family protein [Blastopirellula retiformator]TWT38678.1 hypothetical protein Enr8_03710 [Blastopirellula retiformator]